MLATRGSLSLHGAFWGYLKFWHYLGAKIFFDERRGRPTHSFGGQRMIGFLKVMGAAMNSVFLP